MVQTSAHPGKAHCFGVIARAVKPREKITVSEWADRHRVISSKQSGESGRWRTGRNPILREIQDCLSASSSVREVVVMKSSQVGVTEAIVNWIGYTIAEHPAPFMVLMPTLDARDTWKVQKLNPLLSDAGPVKDILGGLKSRDASNSKDVIDFPGGLMFLSGGNSPNSYAQKSARNVVMDDLDRFPAEIGDEGDPVELARGRAKAFARSKLMLVSTPTVKDSSLIGREYDLTDKRRYNVPCPNCGEHLVLSWPFIKWDEALTKAWYVCEHCGADVYEHHKPKILAAGRWVAEKPEVKRRGYHVSALYAPIGLGPSWLDLAREFIGAKGDPKKLKVFINTQLGELWEDKVGRLTSSEIERRAEPVELRTIPPGCLVLTCGVDTQDGWLAVKILGWGENHLWIIDWTELIGDTSKMEVWDRLEEYLHTGIQNAWGKTMRIRACGIDSRGHRSEQVKAFVSRASLKLPVYAIQGSTTRMGRAIAQQASFPEKTQRGRVIRGGYGVWNVGTEYCKDYIFGHLAGDAGKPENERQFRFPTGLGEAYFSGLLSETYDPEKRRYIPKVGAKHKRNEPLDTLVYAWAIGQHKEVNIGRGRNGRPDPKYWERLGAVLEGEYVRVKDAEQDAPPAAQVVAARLPVRKPAVTQRIAKSEWMKRL